MAAYENIPAELSGAPLWLQYYLSPDPKNPDKKPRKHPEVKYATDDDKRRNLRSLDYLISKRRLKPGGGYQRWINPAEEFVYIDLDNCRDKQTGEVQPWALDLITALSTYTEVSQSGKGLHLVARGRLPEDFKVETNPVEIYSGHIPNKLLALTGDVYELYLAIESRQEQLEQILKRAQDGEFGPGKQATTTEYESHIASVPLADDWPEPMAEEAFHGLAGDLVRAIEPETEADPVALLANFLIAAGVLFGRDAWVVADGKRHYPVEYGMLVGRTGTGRKGTATARVLPVIESVEEGFRDRVLGGLSSGEGLVKGISPKENESSDAVRRFLVLLPEFASLLGVMKREGNTMSAILREAWDGGRLRVLTRKEPLDVDNVNLSVIAHITPGELLNSLTETDRVNGFANRFLLLCVKRSKLLPEGGADVDASAYTKRLYEALQAAKGRGPIPRSVETKELWATEYARLTAGREGLKGALCSRAEAHVLRLSLLYALLDSQSEIGVQHLRAALAVWDYCERSVEYLFAGQTGDAAADKLLAAMSKGPLTISEAHRVFGNNRETEWIVAKLATMARAGLIEQTTVEGKRKESVVAWRRR